MAKAKSESVELEVVPVTMTPEAPASATVRCSIEGFEWLFTVREFEGETPGLTLLSKLKAINEKLKAAGAEPIFGKNAKARVVATAAPAPAPSGNGEPREGWCPIHEVEMPEWHSKDGKRSWRSHKIDGTDEWCKGK